MFGAGNVGRGFIGQLFSESGYTVTFVDIDEELIAALASQHSYKIQLVDNEHRDVVTVAPVNALHSIRQSEQVVQVLARASLAATAVGVRVLPALASLVAECIRRRMADGQQECLNLIICENMKDAAASFRSAVESQLNPVERAYAKTYIGFVDTVIGRMVPPPTPEARAKDVTAILVEPYKELPVDRNGFAGEIPAVVAMQAAANFPVYTARKLYIHNCGHAVLAYLGYLRGYEYGFEALEDGIVRPILEAALSEAQQGIVAHYGVPYEWLQEHTHDLLRRFSNRALGDTVFRLGRDPMRKLAPSDRLVGAARLAESAGRVPEALAMGIAAGYCFDAPADPMAMELQNRIATDGFDAVLAEISGILPGEALAELVSQQYRILREKRGD